MSQAPANRTKKSFAQKLLLLGIGIVAASPLRLHSQQATRPKAPAVLFRDVTATLHLTVPATSGNSGRSGLNEPIRADQYSLDFARQRLIPSMGPSLAVSDFNQGGSTDVYLVVAGASNHLFHALKDGTFSEVTISAKVAGTGSDLSASFADYDHTGHQSLFVAGLGGVTVYHNDGDGTFSDVTAKAGLKCKPGELASSVLLFDADGDGFLDALVTVYADLSRTPEKSKFLFPNDFPGAGSRLFRNNHDGTFREVTASSGLAENPGRTRRALAAHFTLGDRMDLLLLRDNKPPALYRNLGNCNFEEITWEAGAQNWKYAYLDAEVADFNGDGKPDVVLWSTISNEALINQGGGKFKPNGSLPMVFPANRAFGFHGTVVAVSGDGTNDLLASDNRERLHLIGNRQGHFFQMPVAFEVNATGRATTDRIPDLAALIELKPPSPAPRLLLGVRLDGQLIALERKLARKTTSRPQAQEH